MTPQEIRRIREELGLNQAAFARLVKVSRSCINGYESGRRVPCPEIWNRICIQYAFATTPRRLNREEYTDSRGTLCVWPSLPFPVVRTFSISGVPENYQRGHHAHKTCDQIICCARGQVRVDAYRDADDRKWLVLSQGDAMYIPRMHWIILDEFKPGTVVSVLCSEQYKEPITDFEKFRKMLKQ